MRPNNLQPVPRETFASVNKIPLDMTFWARSADYYTLYRMSHGHLGYSIYPRCPWMSNRQCSRLSALGCSCLISHWQLFAAVVSLLATNSAIAHFRTNTNVCLWASCFFRQPHPHQSSAEPPHFAYVSSSCSVLKFSPSIIPSLFYSTASVAYPIAYMRQTSCFSTLLSLSPSKPGIERVQALADISRSRCVVIATQPVHRLQIRPIVHN